MASITSINIFTNRGDNSKRFKMKTSKLLITFTMLIVCGQLLGESIFNTGFEQKNEPFGNFQPGLKSLRANGWTFSHGNKGKSGVKIIKTSAPYGQIIASGSGNGKYGKYFSKEIPESSADKLYLSFDMKINNPQGPGYLAFVYLFGNNDGAKKLKGRSVTMLIYPKKLVFPGKIVVPFVAKSKWTNFQFAVNFKTGKFDCMIDGKIVKKSIPFRNSGIMNIRKITLGGGAPEESVFYDNIYLGTEAASTTATAKPIPSQKLPLAAINYVSTAPVIDGKLNDNCWKQASKLAPFFLPSGKKLAAKQSVAMLCYGKKKIYIAIKCYEPRLHPALNQLDLIKTKQTKHDSPVWTDDSVEIFIRPDMGTEKYFQLAINSTGTIFDSSLPAPGVKWASKAIVKTSRNSEFWSVEMAIPLKTLETDINVDNTVWQMNFCRNRSNPGENSCWSPTFGNFHNFGRFGKIVFTRNVPAITLKQTPLKLQKGSNSIDLELFSPTNLTVKVQSALKFDRNEVIAEVASVALNSNKLKKIKKNFIYYQNTENRKNTKKLNLAYTVFDKNGTIFYNSPWFPYTAVGNSAIETSFIAQTSRVLSKEIEALYINKGGARTVYLLLQVKKELLGKFDKLTTVIELPESVKIINPLNGNRKAVKPDSFIKKIISSNGEKYNRYEIIWDSKYVYPKSPFTRKNSYRFPLLLVMQANKNAKTANYKLKMYSEAKIATKLVREKPSELNLIILKDIAGKTPVKFPIISWGAKNNLIYSTLNAEERKAFMSNRVKAGFNILGLNELGGSFLSDQEQTEIRNYGLKLIAAIPRNSTQTYRSNAFPEAKRFLKMYPKYSALSGAGKILPDSICISELLSSSGVYRKEFKKWLMPLAKKYKYLVWDYEVNPGNPSSTCWCPRCLKEFSKYSRIAAAQMNAALIQKKYEKEWIQFQCQRNAALAQVMKDIISRSAPDCLFSIYSGYQSAHTRNSYGVDWKMMKNSIDSAMCGYGRPLATINATLKAIAPKKLIGGLLIFVWYNSSYSMDNIKIDLYRRLTDSRGGVMLFYDIQADGRMWTAVAKMTKLISDNEEFFMTCKREYGTVKIISGQLANVTVLKGKSGKRIVFVFNPSIKNTITEFTIANKEFRISIPPKDVKTIIIK
jgi:cellulose/xylan binding protein with CBM9 domain